MPFRGGKAQQVNGIADRDTISDIVGPMDRNSKEHMYQISRLSPNRDLPMSPLADMQLTKNFAAPMSMVQDPEFMKPVPKSTLAQRFVPRKEKEDAK